jgi:large subunit ribosomal protein L32
MPNPKRRHSKTRTAKRRTHDALTAANPNECPQCHYPKAQHRICTNCGYYNGRPVRPSGGDE